MTDNRNKGILWYASSYSSHINKSGILLCCNFIIHRDLGGEIYCQLFKLSHMETNILKVITHQDVCNIGYDFPTWKKDVGFLLKTP